MRGLKTKRLLAAAAGLVLVLGVAACGDDDDDDGGGGGGEAQLDLVIGDSLAAHGRSGATSARPGRRQPIWRSRRSTRRSRQAGVDHTVKIVHEDNETNPQAAVQAARKLVDSDGASCIAGAWASADTIPTAQSVSIPEGILQISPASTSAEITAVDDDGLLNRTPPADNLQGPVLARGDRARSSVAPRARSLNIGARNDAYGEGFAGALERRRGRSWAAPSVSGPLRPRAAELQLGGSADRRGQPRRVSRSSISRRPS